MTASSSSREIVVRRARSYPELRLRDTVPLYSRLKEDAGLAAWAAPAEV